MHDAPAAAISLRKSEEVLAAAVRAKGVSANVGDGRNRLPVVHRLDAAHLFRLALEKGTAGSRYHTVCGEGIAIATLGKLPANA